MRGMWRKIGLIVWAGFGGLAPVQSHAEESSLKTLATGNDSRGWEAVGRINLGATGFCTGTLIAPDLVLTAAHCLFDRATGERIAPVQMEFLAGWRNGRAAAYRSVRRAVEHPDYHYESGDKIDRVIDDIAVLQLEQPIRNTSIPPFATGDRPETGDEVGVVSYAQDRAEAASLQEICHVLGTRDGVFVLSCSVDFGSSGAPVFALRNGVEQIVSVISAKAAVDGKPVALSASLAGPLAELLAAVDAGDSQTQVVGVEAVRGLKLSGGAGQSAKFLRP